MQVIFIDKNDVTFDTLFKTLVKKHQEGKYFIYTIY